MKKSLILLAALLAAATAFAHDPSVAGHAAVSGAINNSVSTRAAVNSVGTSFSGAGSNASSAASAALGSNQATAYSPTGFKSEVNTQISGANDTKVQGYAYNVSANGGSGSATSAGWSDAGATASMTSALFGNSGGLNISGSVDTGHPTKVGNGPDVGIAVGTNQGGAAVGVAGGTFDVAGHVAIDKNFTKGAIAGEVSDVKNVTSYAQAANQSITGFTGNTVNANVLNAGADATANASGFYTTNSGQIGNYTGATAPVFKN